MHSGRWTQRCTDEVSWKKISRQLLLMCNETQYFADSKPWIAICRICCFYTAKYFACYELQGHFQMCATNDSQRRKMSRFAYQMNLQWVASCQSWREGWTNKIRIPIDSLSVIRFELELFNVKIVCFVRKKICPEKIDKSIRESANLREVLIKVNVAISRIEISHDWLCRESIQLTILRCDPASRGSYCDLRRLSSNGNLLKH